MIIKTVGRECECDNVSVRNVYGFGFDSPVKFWICEFRQLANKRSRESTHAEKGLFIWPTFPILIPPIIRKGSSPIGSYLLRIAKGFFSTRYTATRTRLLIPSRYAWKPLHTHGYEYARMCRVSYSLSTPNKRATESSTVSLLNLSTTVLQ